MSRAQCDSRDASLINCTIDGTGSDDKCGHNEDAGVICRGNTYTVCCIINFIITHYVYLIVLVLERLMLWQQVVMIVKIGVFD